MPKTRWARRLPLAAAQPTDSANLDRYDTVVIGGGSAGAALAGLLVERSSESVLLVEAGPDYGPFAAGNWPPELVDARSLPLGYDWGFIGRGVTGSEELAFDRGRVIGGCSSVNGCAAVWGSRADYDEWRTLGAAGWSTALVEPALIAASRRLRVRRYAPEEITPFQHAFLEAAPEIGIPTVLDLNDLDQDVGIAPCPVNISNGSRWNAAFAYLDPVRGHPNLSVLPDALADRLIVQRGRARFLELIVRDRRRRVAASRFVLAAGTYGSPAILMRSGIGEPRSLAKLGIEPVHDLPGVGKNLHDHPSITLAFSGTTELERRMHDFQAQQWAPEEQVIAKARSTSAKRAFDLHVYPIGGRVGLESTSWKWRIGVACMAPRSRGALTLTSRDPHRAPCIDHALLSDPDDHDRSVLTDGVELARGLAARLPLRGLLGAELHAPASPRAAISDFVKRRCAHYYHPVGTCRIGSDEEAVVDSTAAVRGIDGLFVADCSIMPIVPRSNTNIPAVALAERIAGFLAPGNQPDAPHVDPSS